MGPRVGVATRNLVVGAAIPDEPVEKLADPGTAGATRVFTAAQCLQGPAQGVDRATDDRHGTPGGVGPWPRRRQPSGLGWGADRRPPERAPPGRGAVAL